MYRNKKFGVFGLGLSGLASIKYLKNQQADFIAFDDQIATVTKIQKEHPELASNLHNLSDPLWQEIDYLILSPGIPLKFPTMHPVVELAYQIGAKIICDIELLYLDNPNAYFIGITGTNGKSTTTALIGHILNYNKVNVMVGGNIGMPVLDFTTNKKDIVYVIEVSSFQLDLLDKTKFNIAVLLNITPDHLDRHGNMDNYIQSKYRIFKHQTAEDYAIIHHSLERDINMISFSEDNQIIVPQNNSLLGKHNQQNLAAAIACCLKYGLKLEQIIAAIPSFVGLKHRMQYLGQYNGITFINDSKATNADSADKALASFNNIIWIAGGVAKEGGISSLKQYFPKIREVLLIGKSSDEFAKTCKEEVAWQKCDNLSHAFKMACAIAKSGDVVLLSPACASYDQWKNFEERGDAFIKLVENFKTV